MRRALAAAAGLSLALAACGKAAPKVKYESPAEEDYALATQDLENRDFPDAQRLLERVRTKYPYSKYAALAELRLADLRFAQQKYVEAAEAYQTFVKLHPNHPDNDYASYRAALSRWEEAPSDFFLFPPVHERDLTQVVQAKETLEAFLKRYPESKYAKEAGELLAKAKGVLAERDWYAYRFYRDREKWQGAAFRLERIVQDFPGSSREPEALYGLAEMYLKLQERFRAQQALQQLLVRYPQSSLKGPAEKLLADLRSSPQ